MKILELCTLILCWDGCPQVMTRSANLREWLQQSKLGYPFQAYSGRSSMTERSVMLHFCPRWYHQSALYNATGLHRKFCFLTEQIFLIYLIYQRICQTLRHMSMFQWLNQRWSIEGIYQCRPWQVKLLGYSAETESMHHGSNSSLRFICLPPYLSSFVWWQQEKEVQQGVLLGITCLD